VQSSNEKSLETHARLLSHGAKIRLARAERQPNDSFKTSVASAIADYRRAIDLVRKQGHWRVNLQIELAASLANLARKREEVEEAPIQAALTLASRAFDVHGCEDCHAYFEHTAASVYELASARAYNTEPTRALLALEGAEGALQQALARYITSGHHLAGEVEERLQGVRRELERMKKPKKIFLSHAGIDKPRVRRFASLLETLGFEPWLDDDALPAGALLERGLEQGMKGSCAAVFFVTVNFKDAKFLEAEIDYALMARRDDPAFKVIAILLEEPAGVPGILERYVHKRAVDDLDALRLILEALPIRVGTVTWRLPSAA
jgi:hypothetical protein